LTGDDEHANNQCSMASLNPTELTDAVSALADHYGLERLRDKLAAIGAFQSRKGLTSPAAIADRLHRLSGGLRLPVAATYAFSHLWGEMLSAKLGGEDVQKELETIADRVNGCLDAAERIVPGREGELDEALAAYREAVARAADAKIAYYDMLLKCVPEVAARVRATAPTP
jgi:hypothetical protein